MDFSAHDISLSPEFQGLSHMNTIITSHTSNRVLPLTQAHQTPKRKKGPALRDHDWGPHRDRIIDLHITQNLPLQRVADILRSSHGFDATSRISKWSLDKKVKKHEMAFMTQKQLQRELDQSRRRRGICFELRGAPVNNDKIERWKARTGFAPGQTVSVPGCSPALLWGLWYWTASEGGSTVDSHASSDAAAVPSFSIDGVMGSWSDVAEVATDTFSWNWEITDGTHQYQNSARSVSSDGRSEVPADMSTAILPAENHFFRTAETLSWQPGAGPANEPMERDDMSHYLFDDIVLAEVESSDDSLRP
ncbi:hypothetical protein B0H66DRAFT_533707 [Apodospora peruviana]|uniref:Clr5 domain-containing protein n=1 Tax=Apodospora peruviana TaxID=516989 RepID=A0AAE0I642_9PEZI|nr:hypothetical protein B0H66DRAFT_533707 [Apodospora peruviana]